MARNAVQFQKGLSEAEFTRLYGTEPQCRAIVIAARWPDGFICPACGGRAHSLVKSRDLFQCTACRRQTSPIAGTIFASTKLPLRTWFRAMYHMTQSKQGISSIELGRRLGVTQTTAWKVKHKLKQVMMERDAGKRLTGRVEIDDVYLGGERRGGKRGRGAPGKTPFVAAVAPEAQPGRGFLDQGIVVICQALPGSGQHRGQRWIAVFHRRHRGRLHPSADGDGRRGRGGAQAGVQMGQYGLGQHQGCYCRDLPVGQQQACAALSGGVSVSLPPTLRSRGDAATAVLGQHTDAADALPAAEIG